MNIRVKTWVMGAALFAAAFVVQAAEALHFQPLLARDVPALLQAPRTRPIIVEIWSLDCSYCRENIGRIAQWRRTAKQNVDVVMVAMDGPEQANMMNRELAPLARDSKVGLARMPQYANAEAMPERMRAALDPGWQGEMPRTIILRADGKRHASSGLLTPEALDAALAH